MFFGDIWAEGEETDGPLDVHALERARSICATCPVRVACHEEAMTEEDGYSAARRFGVWGGITPEQRYSIWRRDAVRCYRCGEVYDPLGLVQGEVACECGVFQEAPIPDTGDQWFPRHDGLLARFKEWLLANSKPGDSIPPPYKMLTLLGHRRKDDMPLCYERLIADGLLEKGEKRGQYTRRAGKKALVRWRPPARRTPPSKRRKLGG